MEINKTQNSNIKSNFIEGAGYVAGSAIAFRPIYKTLSNNVVPANTEQLKNIASYYKKIMPDIDTFENIKNAAGKILEKTGLKAKGVEVNFLNDQNLNEIQEAFFKKIQLKNPMQKLPFRKLFETIKEGANAAFIPKAESIYASEKSFYSSVFHEIGHAHNKYLSKIGKFLQKSRQLLTPIGRPVVGLALFTIGLFHSPQEQNTPQTGWDKVKEFGRKHAGKIAFLTSLPAIFEEAMASAKGVKFAKQYFKPEQIKQLTKNLSLCLNTYIKAALKFSIAIGLGNMVIDIAQNLKKQNTN